MPCGFHLQLPFPPVRLLFSRPSSSVFSQPATKRPAAVSEYHATLTNVVFENVRYFIPRSSWLHNESTISLFSSLIMTYFFSPVHSRRIKLQPFPQRSNDAESTFLSLCLSLVERVILRREVFAREKERKACNVSGRGSENLRGSQNRE